MLLPRGRHALGPENASIRVKTYRQGVASRAGHDLVIDVARWQATLSVDQTGATIELTADPRSLVVREGVHGVKPLSENDRVEIEKNIDEKALRGAPINFRSSRAAPVGDDGRVAVAGNLEMAGQTRPIRFVLSVDREGSVEGVARLTQSEWGIKPYSALMGALKVADEVEVVCAASLPAR